MLEATALPAEPQPLLSVLCKCEQSNTIKHWTEIVHKVGLHVRLYSRMSFIYKYKTSTLTPFVKPHNVLNLAVQKIFYVQLYMESAFMYNPGLTQLNIGILRESNYFFAWKLKYLKYEIYIDNED